MPPNTIENNLRQWNEKHTWSKNGDEWSETWGGTERQWTDFLLPRVRSFLPAPTVLEIAPGRGRWTQFLADLCEQLIIVDLSPRCIEECKARFADRRNISYFVNDGTSLDMVKDSEVDFVFSYDSLVHVDWTTLTKYLQQLHRKLRPGASGFIHHSNARPYRGPLEAAAHVSDMNIPLISSILKKRADRYWRALDASADSVARLLKDLGMECKSQQIFAPGDLIFPIDCMTIFTNSPAATSCKASKIDFRGLAQAARH